MRNAGLHLLFLHRYLSLCSSLFEVTLHLQGQDPAQQLLLNRITVVLLVGVAQLIELRPMH